MYEQICAHDKENIIKNTEYNARTLKEPIEPERFAHYNTEQLFEFIQFYGLHEVHHRDEMVGVILEFMRSVDKSLMQLFQEKAKHQQEEEEEENQQKENEKNNNKKETLLDAFAKRQQQQKLLQQQNHPPSTIQDAQQALEELRQQRNQGLFSK